MTCTSDPKVTLKSLNYNLKSLKFGRKTIDKPSSTYENNYTKEWKQLEIGENDSDKNSATIFCGGSVSSMDWAPVDSDLNFLAVATNSNSKGIKLNLTESSKSCVQLYQFEDLSNHK